MNLFLRPASTHKRTIRNMAAPVMDNLFNIWQKIGYVNGNWIYVLRTWELPNDSEDSAEYLKKQAHNPLSILAVCVAMQNGCDLGSIKRYLESYKHTLSGFEGHMNCYGDSALYYAVYRNSVEALQLLMDYGAYPKTCRIPLLAYAVLHGKATSVNTTGLVKELLARGTDPHVIPSDMWRNYLETPKPTGLIFEPKPAGWCNMNYRKDLAEALHLTHRYSLHRASRSKALKNRGVQIVNLNSMTNLFRAPYYLVGQLPALKLVMTQVFTHVANHTSRPLVMAFARPSGHEKTELATQLGELLAVNYTAIDCTHVDSVTDLFGCSSTYNRSERGSILNNFIAANDDRRAVVFLDELDKTSSDVRNALLIALEKGKVDLKHLLNLIC